MLPVKSQVKIKELEIWGRAQRKIAQRRKTNWEKVKVTEIHPVAKSRGPNSNALSYAECVLSTQVGSTFELKIF